jgi:DNA-binding transcriptional ArsR family regulator
MPLNITEINDPRLVKALAHPLRIEILRILEDRTAAPKDLAKELGVPVTNISYHVKALAELGLIELDELTHVRGAIQHTYRSAGKVQITDEAWGQVPPTAKARIVSNTVGEITRLARSAAASGGFDRAEVALCRFEMTLDAQGFTEISLAANRFLAELDTIRNATGKRIEAAAESDDRIPTTVALMLFENGDEAEASPPGDSEARS